MKNLINESKLPSKRNCLSVLFYNMRFVKLNLHENAHLVMNAWFFEEKHVFLHSILLIVWVNKTKYMNYEKH
jgi:hypothetical protein